VGGASNPMKKGRRRKLPTWTGTFVYGSEWKRLRPKANTAVGTWTN